jgi:hypothetical protein
VREIPGRSTSPAFRIIEFRSKTGERGIESMPEPTDVFHVVGYTHHDILSGGMFRLLTLADSLFLRMGDLYNELGPLDAAFHADRVAREDVEVFFYTPLDFGGAEQFGGDYHVVEFFNDEAY